MKNFSHFVCRMLLSSDWILKFLDNHFWSKVVYDVSCYLVSNVAYRMLLHAHCKGALHLIHVKNGQLSMMLHIVWCRMSIVIGCRMLSLFEHGIAPILTNLPFISSTFRLSATDKASSSRSLSSWEFSFSFLRITFFIPLIVSFRSLTLRSCI